MSFNFSEWFFALPRISKKKHYGIKLEDVISFFEQFSTLIEAGTPILSSLVIASDQTDSEKLSQIIKDISKRVSSGDSLHSGMARYPKVFKPHWCQIIHTGEITGQLGPIMVQLKEHIQETKKMHDKVTGALIYPAILIFVAVASVFIMLWKVVPTFAAFFKDSGAKLPEITQFVVNLSGFIEHNFFYMLIVLAIIVLGFYRLISSYNGKKVVDTILLTTPVFKDLVVESTMEKFSTNLSLLLKNGVNLLEALEIVKDIFRDEPIYYEVFVDAHKQVSRGKSLADSLEKTQLFTTLMISMIKLGEESGNLENVLDKSSLYYREKVSTTIARLTAMIEPVIIIVMGIIFSGILASIYIPMFDLSSSGG